MGEVKRGPGVPGFGRPGNPGYIGANDPDGSQHTLSYHRTLLRVPGDNPVTAYPSTSFAGENVNSFICYTKSNQEFINYATPWEKSHSGPESKAGPGYPVVDPDLAVVGHFGWFDGSSIWLEKPAPRSVGDGELQVNLTMQDLVNGGVSLFVSRSEMPGYERFSTSEQIYQLLTDVNGRVLRVTHYDIIGLQSADNALLVITIAFSVGNLLVRGAAAGIKTLARRFAKEASENLRPALPSGIILGEPPSVRIGVFGEPGNLMGHLEYDGERVAYKVKSIIMKGGKTAAQDTDIQTARLAHREMIRRAAQEARKRGQNEFFLKGDYANANFEAHADSLAREVGVPNSGTKLPSMPGAHTHYQVTLDVGKVLSTK